MMSKPSRLSPEMCYEKHKITIIILTLALVSLAIAAGILWGAYIPLKNKLTRIEEVGLQHGTFAGVDCVYNGACCNPQAGLYDCTCRGACTGNIADIHVLWTVVWRNEAYTVYSVANQACIVNDYCIAQEDAARANAPNTSNFYFDPENTNESVYSDLNDLKASVDNSGFRFVCSVLFFVIGGLSLLILFCVSPIVWTIKLINQAARPLPIA